MNITFLYHKKWVRLLSHLAFLSLSYIVLLRIFTINNEPQAVDHIYTSLFLATLLPVIYVNLEVLIPRAGRQHNWWRYITLLLASVAFFVWLNVMLFDNWSAKLFPDFYFISYYRWWDILLFFLVFLAATTLIKLSKSWFSINDMQQRLLRVEKEKVGMELAALKAQVNPHFFFNTLNSIYALSLQHDARLPSTILQLSEIMRYYLYESREDVVPVEKEIAIIRDYIALQQIRSDQQLDVQVQVNGDIRDQKIAPLLLLTFVENAFKHGAKGVSGASFIHLSILVDEQEFSFRLSNNKGKIDAHLRDVPGLGLQNVKRRLELLYPGKHLLDVVETGEEYCVQLKMNL